MMYISFSGKKELSAIENNFFYVGHRTEGLNYVVRRKRVNVRVLISKKIQYLSHNV